MIEIGAAVEDDFLDARLAARSATSLPTAAAASVSAPVLALVLFERRGGGERDAGRVVDDLGVDVLRRAEDRQTRTTVGHRLELRRTRCGAALGGFLGGHGSLPYKRALPCAVSQAPRRAPCLLLLAFLAGDLLARIAHALALVGLGDAIPRISAATWPTCCLSMPEILISVGFGTAKVMPSGVSIDDVMAEAERQLQVLALHRGAVADALISSFFSKPSLTPSTMLAISVRDMPHGERALFVCSRGSRAISSFSFLPELRR